MALQCLHGRPISTRHYCKYDKNVNAKCKCKVDRMDLNGIIGVIVGAPSPLQPCMGHGVVGPIRRRHLQNKYDSNNNTNTNMIQVILQIQIHIQYKYISPFVALPSAWGGQLEDGSTVNTMKMLMQM